MYFHRMEKHKITEAMRIAVKKAMIDRRLDQAEIAESLGVGRPWMTKFLDGSTVLIKEDKMHRMEKILGILFHSVTELGANASPLAQSVAALVDSDPKFAKLVSSLMSAMDTNSTNRRRYRGVKANLSDTARA